MVTDCVSSDAQPPQSRALRCHNETLRCMSMVCTVDTASLWMFEEGMSVLWQCDGSCWWWMLWQWKARSNTTSHAKTARGNARCVSMSTLHDLYLDAQWLQRYTDTWSLFPESDILISDIQRCCMGYIGRQRGPRGKQNSGFADRNPCKTLTGQQRR